jgi:dTDP-L-rhamnose 4-epimerase
LIKRVLITGGAGFIGSHLADDLLQHGYHVTVLDNLSPQVHTSNWQRPGYLNPQVRIINGDICDREIVHRACQEADAIYHFAACVGVGQSMYEVARYTETNNLGTAILLETLIEHPVERLIVASSMSIYGEGLYCDGKGRPVEGVPRSLEQLKAGMWEVCDRNGAELLPIPTPETKDPSLASVYALSKYDQERLCLIIGQAYQIPTVALRFFNVYGTRQALSNPYTGVLAIFASRLLNNKPPLVYEDGFQKRDFVNVRDVSQACRLALETPEAAYETFNVGSGNQYSVLEIADRMAEALGKSIQPQITGQYRMGDIRHCFADISKARRILGYRPQVSLQDGMAELVGWLKEQVAVDRVDDANRELQARGLTV